MDNRLKQFRMKNGYTQKELASLLNMPYRTYQNYEEEVNSMPKRLEELILFKLQSIKKYDKTEGIYKIKQIKYVSIPIFLRYKIHLAYIGGDYTKEPKEDSSLEFLVEGDIPLAAQFKLIEELENEFAKNIIIYYFSEFDKTSEFIRNIIKKGELILNLKSKIKKKE